MKSWCALISCTVALAQQVDEATYLLQIGNKQRSQEAENCYVKGGCQTTTTTTTTVRRTRPTRPPATTPTYGETVVDTPPDGGETDQPKYCGPEGTEFVNEKLLKAQVNNLGGLGPGSGRHGGGLKGSGKYAGQEVIAYECGIKTPDNTCVDVVISPADDNYKNAHIAKRGESLLVKQARDKAVHKFGRSPQNFASAYNGDKRANVIGIGALVPGEYRFKFSFYYPDGSPAIIDYLPMTFYDLDGKDDLPTGDRYEVATTKDAEGLVAFAHSTLEGVQPIVHGCDDDGVCKVESVTQEVEIPTSFDTLTDDEKSAAATFLFAHKSSIEITYKLNHGHRVFLFKGSKSLYCAEEQEER